MSMRNQTWLGCVNPFFASVLVVFALAVAPMLNAKELPDFADLVEKHGPTVVNVSTKARPTNLRDQLQLDENDIPEFFRRFLPDQPRQNPNTPRRNTPRGERERDNEPPLRELGQGSGFIISNDGYVITNAHVVAKAEEVTVTLTDKREFKAKVIGTDERTDIAVLKIEATGLPKVTMGDSDKLRVGEWVLAIGSPFGFENTVTAGIVSAKQRENREALTPFIQTDVAVNPGNSGGPLFNLKGEVVGVNSQIFSGNGGYLGISFAIPANIAMSTANQLIKSGKINRGRIAVQIGPVGKELAESLGLSSEKGAIVGDVEKDGPADKAGILAQDIIQKINGRVMDSNADVVRTIANMAPGTKATLTIWRKGSVKEVVVTIGETPSDTKTAKGGDKSKDKKKDKDKTPEAKPNRLGLVTNDIDGDDRKELKIDHGVQVSEAEGAAARAGIREGDVILMMGTVDIKSVLQFNDLVSKLGNKNSVALLVKRGPTPPRYLVLKLDGK